MKRLTILLVMALAASGGGCGRSSKTRLASPTPMPKHSMARVDELPQRLQIPLQNHDKHLFVRTTLEGTDGGLFLLDTGAAINAIGMGLAGRLKLPAVGNGTAMGIAGAEDFTYRQVHQLSIGALELDSQRLAAINMNRFATSMGTNVNGVIGFNSLRKAPFTIDYKNQILTIHRPQEFQPPEDAILSPLQIHRGLPMVRADLGHNRQVWMIIDTGADSEVTLPAYYMEQWPEIVSIPMGGAGRSAGVGGHAKHMSTWLKNITLLGVQLHDVPVNFETSGAETCGRRPNVGRLGHRLLENFRLTFVPHRHEIWAEFQPARQSQADLSPLPFIHARLLAQPAKMPSGGEFVVP